MRVAAAIHVSPPATPGPKRVSGLNLGVAGGDTRIAAALGVAGGDTTNNPWSGVSGFGFSTRRFGVQG